MKWVRDAGSSKLPQTLCKWITAGGYIELGERFIYEFEFLITNRALFVTFPLENHYDNSLVVPVRYTIFTALLRIDACTGITTLYLLLQQISEGTIYTVALQTSYFCKNTVDLALSLRIYSNSTIALNATLLFHC